MNVQSVTDAAGSTGDTFDVTLINTGTPVIIAGFSFGLNVGTSDLMFTGVSTGTTTAPYIFDSQSLFGPDISVQPPALPGQTLEAEDIFATISSGATIGTGVTVGLGEVTFNLDPGTPSGGIPLSFISADGSLTDQNGNPIAFSTEDGTVTVTGTAAAPEPAMSGFLCTVLIGLIGAFHLLRRRASKS